MKNFIKTSPLFIFVYISLLAVTVGANFLPQLEEYQLAATTRWNEVKDELSDSITSIEYDLAENDTNPNTVNVFTTIDTGNIVQDSKGSDSETMVNKLGYIGEGANMLEAAIPEPTPEPTPEPEPEPEETAYYVQAPVEQSYFDDVLFLGDSRTVGLCSYSNLKNADYLADVGLNIYQVLNKEIKYNEQSRVTAQDLLTRKRYGKIYIMLGINEAGTGTADSFCEAYSEVVEQIKRWQPNAIIIVQGIMCVSAEKSASSKSLNNNNIRARNEKLATLQNDWNVYYLDINEAVCDENGNLRSGISFDGVHLYAQYYTLWTDYLMEHGFVRNY